MSEDENPQRRVSDKIRDAIERAVEVGRREIAERLRLVYQSVVDEDENHPRDRRGRDRRRR